MQTGVPRLGPRSVTDILDGTFSLYRQNFALFAGIVAVLAIPQTLLNMIITAITSRPTVTGSSTTFRQFTDAAGPVVAASGLEGIIGLFIGLLILGALSLAISRRFLGQPISVLDAYSQVGVAPFVILVGAIFLCAAAAILYISILVVFGVILAVLAPPAAAIVFAILATIGSLVLFVYVSIRLVFVVPAVVIERLGVRDALRRSWQLSGGYWFRIFGLVGLVGVLVGIIGGLVGALAGGLSFGHPVLSAGLSGALGVLVQPVKYTAYTLLYYDQRIRKEGFDLEYAAQNARAESATWAPPVSS